MMNWQKVGWKGGVDNEGVADKVRRHQGEGRKGMQGCSSWRKRGRQQPEKRNEGQSIAEEGYTEGKE